MDNRTPYKTAAELGIAQWEHDGLVALVGPLSRDELTLNMENSCGTVGCIAGHLAYNARRGLSSTQYASYKAPDPLLPLYYPGGGVRSRRDGWIEAKNFLHKGWKATAPQASRAIVNFLVTGDPQWSTVMSEA